MIDRMSIPRLAYLDYCHHYRRYCDMGNKMLHEYVLAQMQSAKLILLDGGYDFWDYQHVFCTPEMRVNRYFLLLATKNIEVVEYFLKEELKGVYVEVESPPEYWVSEVTKRFLFEKKYISDKEIIEKEALEHAESHPSDDEIREMNDRTSPKLCPDTRVELSYRQKRVLALVQGQYYKCVRPRDDECDRVASSISALLHRHSCFDDIYDLCKACGTMDYGFEALARCGFKF